MVGIAALSETGEKKLQFTQFLLLGLRVCQVTIPVSSRWRERKQLKQVLRGAQVLAQAGVRRVLTAPAFPYWEQLRQAGLRPVEPEPICQAAAGQLALTALRWQECAPQQATVLLSAPRVTAQLARAAEELCPQVRYLAVDIPREGERLAAWLQAEFGAAIQPPDSARPQVALFFRPDDRKGQLCFHLYGPTPLLHGFVPVLKQGGLPAGLAPLPLLSLLWEEGRIHGNDVVFLPPNPRQFT